MHPIERLPSDRDIAAAHILAGTLARRCGHTTLPLLASEDSGSEPRPIANNRQKLYDMAESLGSPDVPSIRIELHPSHEILPWLNGVLSAPARSRTAESTLIRLLCWNPGIQPDPPSDMIRFLDALSAGEAPATAILVGLPPDDSAAATSATNYLQRHLDGRIPLFTHTSNRLAFHWFPDQQIAWPHAEALPRLLALAVCYAPFRDLLRAVRAAVPAEANALVDLFQDTFQPSQS